MRREPFLRWIAAGALAPMAYFSSRWRARVAAATPAMDGGMMNMINMQGPMRTGIELFAWHANVKRTVTQIPQGIHAVSESEDPRTAALLREHVVATYARLDSERPFPYPMSRSVPTLSRTVRYHRKLTMLPKGIAVTETFNNPAMVQIIRAHAREINGFVRDGMPAMMPAMMQP